MQLTAPLRAFARATHVSDADHGSQRELAEFLARDPESNLFMLSWLENYGVCAPNRPDLFAFTVARRRRSIVGVSLLVAERLALLDAVDAEVARELGAFAFGDGHGTLDHVVSRRAAVAPYWAEYARRAGATPRLVRDQQLLALHAASWQPIDAEPPRVIKTATARDLDAVFLASAQMHAEETLEDPLTRNATQFRRHVEHRIENGRTFAWFDQHRRLRFKADISAHSSWGVQISGVYTPPACRGQGIATRAMREICALLFERGCPRITLYVNRTNTPAIKVYRRVGFEQHTDYQTVFVQATA